MVQAAGFKGNNAVTAVAIVLAESKGKRTARCYNFAGHCTFRFSGTSSTDRGIFQINDKAHRDVSDQCADNPACAASAAFRISLGGTTFRAWSTYNSGSSRKFMDRARKALA